MADYSGIYRIKNTVNGKVYIGSAERVKRRLYLHVRMLKGGFHDNIHLQRAWDKQKGEGFTFRCIERVSDKTKLLEREQFWLDELDACKEGYNICPTAGSRAGVPQPEGYGLRMSALLKGRPKSEAHRAAISRGKKGVPNSPEHIANQRIAMKKYFSKNPEARKQAAVVLLRFAGSNKGQSASETARLRMSASAKVAAQRPERRAQLLAASEAAKSSEARLKNSLSKKGRKLSDETRARMSAGQLARTDKRVGHPHDDKWCANHAATIKAKWADPIWREKMLVAREGKIAITAAKNSAKWKNLVWRKKTLAARAAAAKVRRHAVL